MKEHLHKVLEYTANLPLPRQLHSQQEIPDQAQLPHTLLSVLPLRLLSQMKRGKYHVRQESTFCLGAPGSCYKCRGAERIGVQWVNHGAM